MKIIKINRKKIISIFSFASLVFLSLFFMSCEGDDEVFDVNSDVIEDLERGVLRGLLQESRTLNPDIEYSLPGSFAVSPGVELTIPAGTNIIATNGGSNIFIVVLPGAKIFVNGTADEPVYMGTRERIAGGWSGLTMYGGAHSLGVRSSSQFLYGGDNEADSSGSISYLTIAGAGNALRIDEKTNGLGLFGVGSGTEMENIAILNSADDALDIYGGAVSIENLYVENTGNHSINWNEGWNGTISNAYILDDGTPTSVFGGNFVYEDPENPINFEFPTFNNLTVAASSDFDTKTENTVFKLHTDTGAFVTGLNIVENIYDADINMLDEGDVSNLNIDGSPADVSILAPFDESEIMAVQSSSTIAELVGTTIVLADGTEILVDDITTLEQDSTTITIDANTLTAGDTITVVTTITPDREYNLNSGKDASPIDISGWNWIVRSLD